MCRSEGGNPKPGATTGGKEGVGKNSIAVGFYRTIFFIYHIDVLFILK
jgi:hypothetical protein